jgi:hypothetical protein
MNANVEKPLFADVTIKWKNDGTTQDVRVTLAPEEEIDFEKHCLTDDDIFFYFNNVEDFKYNQLNLDENDFQIINVYNFY